MLKKRIIPKLQLVKDSASGFVLNTTRQFNNFKSIGNPISQAKIYQANNVDELMFVNIDSLNPDAVDLVDVVKAVAREIFTPFSVGGGIQETKQIQNLLKAGADKVIINRIALDNPDFISKASEMFGAQCIVVSIDYRTIDGEAYVFSARGKKQHEWTVIDWAKKCAEFGAGELAINSIDRDGMKNGLDIELLKTITEHVTVPVIASGGCGLASHFVEGFRDADVDAVASGTYFCLQDQNPMQCRAHIKNANIPIRINI